MKHVLRIGRRIGIAVSGGAVILAGIILAIPAVPGPGLALILLGLGILSVEFEFARVWLAHIKEKGLKLKDLILRKLEALVPRKLKNLILRRKKSPSTDEPPSGEQ